MNVSSIVEAIKDFEKVSGSVEAMFADNLFHDSYLGLALHECFNRPNLK